jgi:pyruvate/2-oxoglutarate dehydrogenase complex dihydrolipoamide dehydrogenase (E3) component
MSADPMPPKEMDVVVIGAGPAGVLAALRAADLGARTTLVTRGAFGGLAAHDGPVPVRTLAHAARLVREARQLERYGVLAGAASLDYPRLLARVAEVVEDVNRHSALRPQIDALGVTVREHVGDVRFIDAHTLETADGLRLRADRVIICTGGVSRRLDLPGFDLTCTHSDAWSLSAAPGSMLVVGAGATGAQVASVFNALGTKVQLFQAGERILPTEDEAVSAAVAAGFRASGVVVHEGFGAIDSFERTASGVRMNYSKDGQSRAAEAELVVAAVGWSADTGAMNLAAAGVETTARGFIQVDEALRTTAPHVFAAGDVTGRLMLVPQAMRAGLLAAANAVTGAASPAADQVAPVGSFTQPEYAQVGLTEAAARARHEVLAVSVDFAAATRPIIDGRTEGFCKLVIDRPTRRILGCHVVGERAVDIVQLAAVAMAAGLGVDGLAQVPFSFPTYAGVLGRVAASATYQLNRTATGDAELPPAAAFT